MAHDILEISRRAQGLINGEVTPDEIEYARNILRTRSEGIVPAIEVVSLLGNKLDYQLIEPFIHGSNNSIYAEYALTALCRNMGLTAKFRNLLRQLAMGPFIEGDYKRIASIHLMKEYFEDFEDNELGCHLTKISADFNDLDRVAARNSLVDILQLKEGLVDPYGLNAEVVDEDLDMILSAAVKKFRCDIVLSPDLF